MSLVNRIRKEIAETTGFREHPVGTFAGVIESVNQKEHEGRILWEIHLRTEKGKPKVTIWKNMASEIDALASKFGDRGKAEERYVKHMARVCRLYADLGLQPVTGESEVDMEDQAYGRLGEMIGKSCTVVVQPDRQDPNKRAIFINAPRGGATVSTSSDLDLPTSAFEGQKLPTLEEIPF